MSRRRSRTTRARHTRTRGWRDGGGENAADENERNARRHAREHTHVGGDARANERKICATSRQGASDNIFFFGGWCFSSWMTFVSGLFPFLVEFERVVQRQLALVIAMFFGTARGSSTKRAAVCRVDLHSTRREARTTRAEKNLEHFFCDNMRHFSASGSKFFASIAASWRATAAENALSRGKITLPARPQSIAQLIDSKACN